MIDIFHDFYRGKRVLVTGHTGFKGSWLSIWLSWAPKLSVWPKTLSLNVTIMYFPASGKRSRRTCVPTSVTVNV